MSFLPSATSWFPGHMATFTRHLPALLGQTHVVLEVRDVRLPLTSINPTLEAALEKWKKGRKAAGSEGVCERIVVYTKRDLIDGGETALKNALSKHFDHQTHFNSNGNPRDLKALHNTIATIARSNAETTPTLNVLVVGMPNMGKSTLLNSLRWAGTSNATKALRTSALPGLTQKTSERLRLCFDPSIYAVDSPGVMMPFLGHGDEGKERAFKLALIAGIKESLFDDEMLAAYLLYRLNRLNPSEPAYLHLYPSNVPKVPTDSVEQLLEILADRLGARLKGGEIDVQRTAKWFIKWWREGGARSAPMSHGWGFDFDWADGEEGTLEEKMERRVKVVKEELKTATEDGLGYGVSATKEKNIVKEKKRKAINEKRKAVEKAKSVR